MKENITREFKNKKGLEVYYNDTLGLYEVEDAEYTETFETAEEVVNYIYNY